MNISKEEALQAARDIAIRLTLDDLSQIYHNDSLFDAFDEVLEAKCAAAGHQPEDDHCGKPEHRFCFRCGIRMPNAEIARQGKADEPEDRKSSVPSESLGSGSNKTLSGWKWWWK